MEVVLLSLSPVLLIAVPWPPDDRTLSQPLLPGLHTVAAAASALAVAATGSLLPGGGGFQVDGTLHIHREF